MDAQTVFAAKKFDIVKVVDILKKIDDSTRMIQIAELLCVTDEMNQFLFPNHFINHQFLIATSFFSEA